MQDLEIVFLIVIVHSYITDAQLMPTKKQKLVMTAEPCLRLNEQEMSGATAYDRLGTWKIVRMCKRTIIVELIKMLQDEREEFSENCLKTRLKTR